GCVISGLDCLPLFEGDTWTFRGPSACQVRGRNYPVRADRSASPPTFDLTTADGQTRRGICRVAGDELLWADGFTSLGRRRPVARAWVRGWAAGVGTPRRAKK